MAEFKTQTTISIFSIDAIELNIIPKAYGIFDADDEILHIIE